MTTGAEPRPPVGAIRRLVRRLAAGSQTAQFVLAIMVVLTVLILTAPTRTIQLEARSLSAEVQIMGEPLQWNLDGAIVCVPSMDRDLTDPECGALSSRLEVPDEDYEWLRGQKLRIDWTPGALRITSINEGPNWPANTVFVLSHEDARRNGALAFFGLVSIGQEIGAGSTDYVLDGQYAIYEKGVLARFLPSWSPDVTRQGALRRGDAVRIVCKQNWFSRCDGEEPLGKPDLFSNQVSGSITMDSDGNAGIHIVGLGVEANSMVEIAYAGRSEPLLVRPNWIQRAAASSGLLALSLLFSLIAPLLLPFLEVRKT